MKWSHKAILAEKPSKDTYYSHDIAGLRLRIYPTTSGHKRLWDFRRMVKGTMHRGSLGSFPEILIAEAQEMAVDINRRIALGETPFEPVVETVEAKLTVRKAWDSYIADRIRAGQAMLGAIQTGEQDLIPVLGGKALSEITSDDIRTVVQRPLDRCKGNGRGEGKARSNEVRQTCNALWNWCIRQSGGGYDEVKSNPVFGVAKTRFVPLRKHILSVREMAQIILAARKFDAERGDTSWSDIITLYCYLGNRTNELLNMPKSEWKREHATWFLPAARYKTYRDLDLPLGPKAAAIFDRLSQEGFSPFMIPPQYGVRRGSTKRAVAGITKQLQRDFPKWSLHSLRYGFRANIRREGIADRVLAEQLIHPRAKGQFSEHYDPPCPVEMCEALTNWEERLDREVQSVLTEAMTVAA